VRRWEAGERDIPGPVVVIVEMAIAVPAALSYLRNSNQEGFIGSKA
jgi:hypothetical protein